jgi:hypothetical protein
MLYDNETRTLIAREHAELLRAQAQNGGGGRQRTRRWLSEHLISAGERLAPECQPRRRPARAV